MAIATASVDQNTIRRRGTGLRAYNPDKVFKGYTRMALRKAQRLVSPRSQSKTGNVF